ncbi:SRPBCC family protein [Rhodoferax sp.]|uniref:SRPBCC family protein n=1 Tax=Rhodoferax sp. TaxID=50421 RepID=UPI00374DC3C1
MTTTLAFVAAFCVVAVLVYMARYSGRVKIARTRLIEAPLDQVFAQVADFQNWQAWNPWLAHEAQARVEVTGKSASPGSQLAWTGTNVGAGRFEWVRGVALKSLEQRMQLKQPFVVRGRSQWTFATRDGKTEVRWQIHARVAFAMRAFSQTVKGALDLDCTYALDRLASILEPANATRYQLTVLGPRDVEACRYVYQTYKGTIKGLPDALRQGFADLRAQLAVRGISAVGAPLALYLKTNIKLRTTVCRIGLPIGHADAGEMTVRDMPAHRAYGVRFQGGYDALEIGWYQAMQRLTTDNLKPDQRLLPFETYLVTAETAQSNDFVTELNLPLLAPN